MGPPKLDKAMRPIDKAIKVYRGYVAGLKNPKYVAREIKRNAILDRARAHLEAMEQWAGMGHYDHALRYQAKAEALIELVEINDCGSIGGFDHKRGQDRAPNLVELDNIIRRYGWLAAQPFKPYE